MDAWDNDGQYDVAALSSQKCSRCGSKKHASAECTVDMAKVKCFRCGVHGHIGMNCNSKQDKGKGRGSGEPWKGASGDKGKGKTNDFSKGKGKGKGKGFKGGRKGKLNELSSDQSWEEEQWWTDDSGWYWYDASVEQVSYWNDHDWYDSSWYDSSWYSSHEGETPKADSPPSKDDKPQNGQNVGSLVLSAVFQDGCEQGFSCFCDFSFSEWHDMTVGDDGMDSFESCVGFDALEPSRDLDLDCSEPNRDLDASGPYHDSEVSEPYRDLDASGPYRDLEFSEQNCALGKSKPFGNLGLKGFGVAASCFSKGFHEGLVVENPMSLRRFCVGTSTFLNVQQEMSSHAMLRKYAGTVFHLLSEVAASEGFEWWLLDSGAAVTVLAHQNVQQYGVNVSPFDRSEGNFCAANGSAVNMHGRTSVSVCLSVWGPQHNSEIWKHAGIHCLVGSTRHNILSTTVLSRSGWTFQQSPSGSRLWHEDSGFEAAEVIDFCGCPWVKLHPGKDDFGESVGFVGDPKKEVPSGMIQPLSKAARNELEDHRNRGHTPHNPNCLECARGRSTFKHRRRSGDVIESEIQADFGFISQQGEVSEMETEGAIKILVMTEMASNAIAYVVVDEDISKTRALITKWLLHFGLESERMSIILHTDAEQAVRSLITSSSTRFSFQVRKASNQQHQSIGGAERGVRRMKESLAILRADITQGGWDVRFDAEHLGEALTYLALMHNHYGKSRETDLSPLELASGRRLTKPATALFGSTVLAEIPSSLRKHIEAAYLHPGIDHGPMVQGVVRNGDELQLVKFCARNVRNITPISWKTILCDSFLRPVGAEIADRGRGHLQDQGDAPGGQVRDASHDGGGEQERAGALLSNNFASWNLGVTGLTGHCCVSVLFWGFVPVS